MYAVSDRFLEALRYPHDLYVEVMLVDATGAETPLPIIDGEVTLDINSTTRAALSLTLPPMSELVPTAVDSLLAPYGNEIRVKRGIQYSDDEIEAVPLGVFRLDGTSVNDTGADLSIEVTALDRSAGIIEAVFEEAGSVPSGTNAHDQIIQWIASVYPWFDTSQMIDTGVTVPLCTYEAGEDRWEACLTFAEVAGCDLFFDSEGRLALRPVPRQRVEPDWEVVEGEGGTMLSITKDWSREDAVNKVVVNAENSQGDPVIGSARDMDPHSPTYFASGPGQFGRVTFVYDVPTADVLGVSINTQTQANSIAARILGLKLGAGQQISFESLVNPALRPLDVVLIQREQLGLSETHIVDSLTIPLTEAGMSGQTRVARVMPNG